MAVPSAPAGLCDLFVAYIRGDAAARDRFPIESEETLARLTERHGWYLPPDIRAEVVSEAHLILLQRGAGFDPTRSTARVYLRLIVRDAVKRVAASYCPPGWRTRPSRVEAKGRGGAALSLEQHMKGGADFACPRAERESECACDLRTVFDRAPGQIATALKLIYLDGQPVERVAMAVGVTRFTLLRQIRAFAASCQTAA